MELATGDQIVNNAVFHLVLMPLRKSLTNHFFLQLISLGEWKPAVLHLNIDCVSHPVRSDGFVTYIVWLKATILRFFETNL